LYLCIKKSDGTSTTLHCPRCDSVDLVKNGHSENGTQRRIKVGRGILFKHTSNARNLAYKSELLMLIVMALREIGESKVTDEQLAVIKEHFSHISQKEFETDIKLIPLWIRKLLLSL
jgi:hypothetical protein